MEFSILSNLVFCSDDVKNAWDITKTVKQNMAAMGLAYDINDVKRKVGARCVCSASALHAPDENDHSTNRYGSEHQ